MCNKPDFRLVDDNPVFQACDGGGSSSFTPSVGVHEQWPFGCTHLRQQLAKQFLRELKAFLFFPALAPSTIMASRRLLRQLFDKESSTYTYLLADMVAREAILIDPVIEQVFYDYLQDIFSQPSPSCHYLAAKKNDNIARQTGTWVS